VGALRGKVHRLVASVTETRLPSPVTRMREGRDWKRWVTSLERQLFDHLAQASDDVKRNLFKAHVSLVEIEVHAKCNRICPFCPNVIVDRRKNNILTDADLLDRVFRQLGSIGRKDLYHPPVANRNTVPPG